jgi:putative intracellular protease/amidase
MTTILIALTSHGTLGETGRPTGFYLPEVVHPYTVFRQAGYAVAFVSPQGGQPPMDGVDPADPALRAFLDDAAVMAQLAQTPTPADLAAADYAAIFYAGGHGAMWDLATDATLAKLAAAIYAQGGVVAAVCHGPAGLVNIQQADGSYLVAGKTVAAFTNAEEAAVGLTDVVPFLLETTLGERGAQITSAPNFQEHTVVSERLVTGQNPASATAVARHVVAALAGQSVHQTVTVG